MKLRIKAYAKVNLTLDVLSKREDGYHEILSVMQSIDLADVIEFEKAKEILFECDHERVPKGEENLIMKAFNTIRDRYFLNEGVKIKLFKNIPLAAGLAGGSADAAATIVALDKLWNLNLTEKEMEEIASEVGSDVPFCLKGGTKLASGRGEKLQDLEGIPLNLLLVKPDLEISTKEVYTEWDNSRFKSLNSTFLFVEALKKGDLLEIARNISNDLERVTSQKYRVIEDIKKSLIEKGALSASMTGSGPTVYGVFNDVEKLVRAYHDLKGVYPFVTISKTVDKGLEIL
ncbi:4-(cytidine 5'-diphospho)-2-C-methyl-D-erythritol kinase [Caldanaerobacter subterraneus]|uniref:4-diphosphocytidyl-2-C-methyl-D-erythritol kinase n=1 Tax=Caldanaerobacter subterraneus TaxID=911092 RepID=A0A7Y2L4P9_9THEO|nr:4-(cytidine 5'-diphospho)-2-C-methyl-D-erythritol kinase [Caldanaerobacter subterraneus]NNG65659.1 4-(cytidine 5'-diphospho)-2-C-methyl-D-erythritol kinase [Caldanaerobacter subterraneus]